MRFSLSILCCFFISTGLFGQGFKKEVAEITKRYDSLWDQNRSAIVFTGSSSIRLWEGLEDYFPEHQIINTGFGGSKATDLRRFLKPLVLRYNPSKVFIYEGDNDLEFKRSPQRILRVIKRITKKVQKQNPDSEIILLAAKPSLVRWHLKEQYEELNQKLRQFALESPNVNYADVWSIMLEGEALKDELFIEDGLHMNEQGYALWYKVIEPFIN